MNLAVLAPDMDLYQQAEEEDKTELEVLEEREVELRRLLDYHYLREQVERQIQPSSARWPNRLQGSARTRTSAREASSSSGGRPEVMVGKERETEELFMCEHPSSYMFVSDQLAKLHPTLFESGIVASVRDLKWFEADTTC